MVHPSSSESPGLFIVGNEWLPNRQTVLELYGSTGVNSTQLSYGLDALQWPRPIDEYQGDSLDTNKAVRRFACGQSRTAQSESLQLGYVKLQRPLHWHCQLKYNLFGPPPHTPFPQRYDRAKLGQQISSIHGAATFCQSEAIVQRFAFRPITTGLPRCFRCPVLVGGRTRACGAITRSPVIDSSGTG